jgi:FMN phosphatase YigB (HAD superfamily)
MRKDNETIWQYLAQKKDFMPSRHVHIGDNIVSDVQIPGDYGIANQALLNPMDKWLLNHPSLLDQFDGLFSENCYAIGALISSQGYNPFITS